MQRVKLTYMLTNSGHDSHQSPASNLAEYGVEEEKNQPPIQPAVLPTSPGFAANFVVKDEEPNDSPKEKEDALTSVWNTDIKRSNSPDVVVPPQVLLSTSYDEIDVPAKMSPPPVQPSEDEKSTYSVKSLKLESRPAEYSGRASYDIPVDDDDEEDEKVDDRRLSDKKKSSFFSRALFGFIGDSSSNVTEKKKSPAKSTPELVDPSNVEVDLESGGGSRKDVFLRGNSETENAPKAMIRRGSTNAEIERELTRKKSITTSHALANEAAARVAQRRASERGDLESNAVGGLVVRGDDIEKQLGGGEGEDEEKSVGSGRGPASVISSQSTGRKSNRSNQKMTQML